MTGEDNPFYLKLFDKTVLQRPLLVILIMTAVFAYLGYKIKDFRLDASEDSLVLEDDQDLKLYRQVTDRYGTSDYLFLTYSPNDKLLKKETLATVRRLAEDLKKIPNVESVVSLLDIPLLSSPPIELNQLKDHSRKLESPDVDFALAEKELRTNPTFRNLLVSPDLKMTALQINLVRDKEQLRLQKERSKLLDKKLDKTMTPADEAELRKVKAEYKVVSGRVNQRKHKLIADVRALKGNYQDSGKLFLGGVSMVTDDMMSFVRNDLKVFGVGMLIFIVCTLWVIFRKKRWIFLPMICCVVSALSMMGILGVCGWEVTVISSNFVSLQLIVTMSLTIHLIVRYKELLHIHPDMEKRALILETVRTIFKPCLYTSLTTIAGFSSLVTCNILPVINFGWMMSLGLALSLGLVFLLFPAAMMLMPKVKPNKDRELGKITALFARFTEKNGRLIITAAIVIAGLTGYGISQLKVENSFIDYFRQSTEIYQGMKLIDQQLGGTTPLDIVMNLEEPPKKKAPAKEGGADDEFGEFEEFEEPVKDDKKYWFTMQKMEQVSKVHKYLESQPAIGKVLSLQTMLTVAKTLIKEDELDNLTLALLFKELPDDFREILVDPYVSVDNNEVRLTMRIKDSMPGLERGKLLRQIRKDLVEKVGLKPDKFKLCGIMVLYNNMLQSLFKSQIQTIGLTVTILLVMFLILFRSIKVSIIAIIPNLLACLVVLGLMGLIGIPLDMMTITIVAISMGIAVDNTIHYIHRFRHEIKEDGDYIQTMHRCHGSIGNAMYYTSITIIAGFSILALSNFIPSVLFGLLTGVAMLMALLAALTLLPRLIILVKPFGKEGGKESLEESSSRGLDMLNRSQRRDGFTKSDTKEEVFPG